MSEVASTFSLERALERFPRFALRDLEAVRHQGSQVFCDHQLRLSGTERSLDAQVYYRPLQHLGLGRLSYGAAVDIDPGALHNFYLLQIPLSGHERVVCDGQEWWSDAQCASLISPTQRLQMHHAAGTQKLFLRVDAAALDALARHEWQTDHPLRLHNMLDWRNPDIQGLRRMLAWLFEEVSCGQMLEQRTLAQQIERSVMLALLQAARLEVEPARERVIQPGFVRRAIECIHARAQQPLSIGDIAAAVGVSRRSLYAGFRQYVGETPLAYLKSVRLDGVHTELQAARARGDGVSDVALRWGFFHLGQFAADYRQRFGERPSETLQRGART